MIKFGEHGFYYSTLINDDNYFSGFSSKELGDGTQVENIFRFLEKNNIDYKKVVKLDQIHSSNIEFFINAPSSPTSKNTRFEKIEDTDGVITEDEGVFITVQTADCIPLILVDKKIGIIGVSHQGWRGLLKRLPIKMVQKMVEMGSQVKDVVASIGPAIGVCCYEIGEDYYHDFQEEFESYVNKIFKVKGGKFYLNLNLLTFLLLIDAGVKKENIDFFPFCTKCQKDKFYSFRREGKSLEGEMFSFIMKRS
ncbi:MAG: peptidoglycan editing factor PgeF [Candidatus Roizmanbacteria bacterium]|nr:MAG: peptidoglycan editing factor PgeF [Candidatus Roizmanbacteria bacterium]